MNTESRLDELEVRLARTAADLLQAMLQLARARADGADQAGIIDALPASRLIVAVAGSRIQIQLQAPGNGGALSLYSACFEEVRVLQ